MLWAVPWMEVVITVCQGCGSRRFRADRALAGRLVCQNCGLAAGSRPARKTTQRNRRSGGRNRWGWFLLLLIAVVVMVLLTA